MTITIELRDELEAKLTVQARARGMDVAAYAAAVLEEAAHPAPVRPADLQRTLAEMAQFSHKIPALPDEAFSRESIYKDHD